MRFVKIPAILSTVLAARSKPEVGNLFTVTGRMNCPLALAGRKIGY